MQNPNAHKFYSLLATNKNKHHRLFSMYTRSTHTNLETKNSIKYKYNTKFTIKQTT